MKHIQIILKTPIKKDLDVDVIFEHLLLKNIGELPEKYDVKECESCKFCRHYENRSIITNYKESFDNELENIIQKETIDNKDIYIIVQKTINEGDPEIFHEYTIYENGKLIYADSYEPYFCFNCKTFHGNKETFSGYKLLDIACLDCVIKESRKNENLNKNAKEIIFSLLVKKDVITVDENGDIKMKLSNL